MKECLDFTCSIDELKDYANIIKKGGWLYSQQKQYME